MSRQLDSYGAISALGLALLIPVALLLAPIDLAVGLRRYSRRKGGRTHA